MPTFPNLLINLCLTALVSSLVVDVGHCEGQSKVTLYKTTFYIDIEHYSGDFTRLLVPFNTFSDRPKTSKRPSITVISCIGTLDA